MNSNIHLRVLSALLVAVGLLASAPAHSAAQMSVVVAAGSAHEASQEQIAQMFSGQATSWPDGTEVQLVFQTDENSEGFFEALVSRTSNQVRRAVTQLLLSGQITKPETATADADVKSILTRLPNAIGYMPTASLDGTVKELARIE